jgi:hypothetical protein
MTTRTDGISPQRYARTGGVLYLIIIAAGILGQLFVRGTLVVSGDATATTHQIMAAPSLWRIGIAGDIIMHVCDLPLMLILYLLLRPVNRNLALLALLFNLIQTAVLVANKLILLVPLYLIENANYLKAFTPDQLEAVTYIAVKAHDYGFGVGLIFFGFTCLVVGYLIFCSGFLPRILGIFMQMAGLSYLINSFALLLAPAFASLISPAILLPAFIGELSFCLWFLLKGVNGVQWEKRALAAA